MSPTLWTAIVIVAFVVLVIKKTAVVVPQQSAFVIQRLGKYSRTLNAGFHILIPLFDTIAYRHSLKEEAVEVAEQVCITADNVQVAVDGILYLKVLDPERTSYGINNYEYAVAQLTQTTLRSEIGKLALDRTFEARSAINAAVVYEVDKATEAWGVKVMRYEIKNITPPQDVLAAMEKQMRAEREKRANILQSEGIRDAKINEAEGQKQRVIKESEATMQLQINEARGKADAILAVADATAQGLEKVAQSLKTQGGERAMELRIAEQYITQFGQIAKAGNMIVLPANMSDLGSMIAMAKGITASPPKVAA